MTPSLRTSLLTLLNAVGPSGYEHEAVDAWCELAASVGDVQRDRLGGAHCIVNPGGSPRVLLVGHIDEIGFTVKHIDEQGMLWLAPIGGWDPSIPTGQRVRIRTRAGHVPGVFGTKARHMMSEDEMTKAPQLKNLWVDIGASSGEEARKLVRIGDPLVLEGPPIELAGGRIASRALDNRLGALAALEGARRAGAELGLAAEVIAVAAVREEITYAGAATAAYKLDPDVAIAIDVTHATDVPIDGIERAVGEHPLGSGPTISRGAAMHEGVAARLIELAEGQAIPFSLEADGISSWTDAEAVHAVRGGVPCGLLGIPLRGMHSPCETADLKDLEYTAELAARFCRSLVPGQEWR